MPYRAHTPKEILFEGLSEREILDLPLEQIDELILIGEPIVFRAGSSTILGGFRRVEDRLVIELAHIDGGGEGVLVSLGSLARRFAQLHGVQSVEWIVHAVNCAKPNLKLRRVLERRGFAVRELEGIGAAYYLLESNVAGAPTEAALPINPAARSRPRQGWAEASNEIAARGEDKLVIPEFGNEGDADLRW